MGETEYSGANVYCGGVMSCVPPQRWQRSVWQPLTETTARAVANEKMDLNRCRAMVFEPLDSLILMTAGGRDFSSNRTRMNRR